MLTTCILKSLTKLVAQLMFIGMMTCLHEVSRSLMVDFVFIFSFPCILFFVFFLFSFLFLEQLRLGFISHAVTSVTN